MMRSYSELIAIPDFYDRIRYLQTSNDVGEYTFGGTRSINQTLYRSASWKRIRREVILRDNGCDLAHPDFPIGGRMIIHHIEPITLDDIANRAACVFDLNNLVCVSHKTHNTIHYATDVSEDISLTRMPNDTLLWPSVSH